MNAMNVVNVKLKYFKNANVVECFFFYQLTSYKVKLRGTEILKPH